jgi:hypothetical protein
MISYCPKSDLYSDMKTKQLAFDVHKGAAERPTSAAPGHETINDQSNQRISYLDTLNKLSDNNWQL